MMQCVGMIAHAARILTIYVQRKVHHETLLLYIKHGNILGVHAYIYEHNFPQAFPDLTLACSINKGEKAR